MTKEEAFELGRNAKSILENPFWKDYPKHPESDEATLGRFFVEGYVSIRTDSKTS